MAFDSVIFASVVQRIVLFSMDLSLRSIQIFNSVKISILYALGELYQNNVPINMTKVEKLGKPGKIA